MASVGVVEDSVPDAGRKDFRLAPSEETTVWGPGGLVADWERLWMGFRFDFECIADGGEGVVEPVGKTQMEPPS